MSYSQFIQSATVSD
ncbi:Hypothetical small peptide [Latilactobacillus sakei subsp. sakei 23K]|uniref:Hypothetical small peptide n=1 Tax=Latilactobacillus sakei subsp. sakei (strain 23K) TaxID=314315 RepID=Q38Z08_LATSS|nr:Hypothetical small peptide [Latilactobacillus sakei subsp. sakei 23K]